MHFATMAKSNACATARLLRMPGALQDVRHRKNVGAYLKSLHGTRNQLVVTDRILMRRLTGLADHPAELDAICDPGRQRRRPSAI
jgi:uncharacterized damage-inducible protein DinB